MGLPEKADGQNPGELIEAWLTVTFPDAKFSSAFAVERAHRVPANLPLPGAAPHPMVARMLNCKDRDLVLHKVRQEGQIKYENAQISIFLDFSVELQKQRASFIDIKKRMREQGYVYSMSFPARLRVIDGSKVIFLPLLMLLMTGLQQRVSLHDQCAVGCSVLSE